jgi:two-component system LytT family response regulator
VSLRAVVVDDEPLARRRLRRLLATEPGVEVVADCGDGPAALEAIARTDPDLLFLDIEMPGMDGLAVAGAAGSGRPGVIFVTAHEQYALPAFDSDALDYLLKPVEPPRLRRALERARAGLAPPPSKPLERLLVHERGRAVVVRVADLDYLDADGNYVWLHGAAGAVRYRTTLAALAAGLDPERFRRISRSCVVNLDRVREIRACLHGDALVILHSGVRLRLSRRYRDQLLPAR